MVTVVGTRGPVWEASQNVVVALIGLSDGRRSRERRAPVPVYRNLAGKGLTCRPPFTCLRHANGPDRGP